MRIHQILVRRAFIDKSDRIAQAWGKTTPMPALTWKEKEKQKTLYEMGYEYLVSNFSKFKDSQKIKIALEVIHIFNKDGSKSNDSKQIIFVVNSREASESIASRASRAEENILEVFPSQSPAENQSDTSEI